MLAAGEPSPFYVHNALSESPILLVCDHASCRFPAALGDMGLDPFARRCHLAIDIGAGPLTERLSASLGVTAVVAQYSRLVIDLNREILDPGAFLEFGDGILVPGNRNLHPADKEARIASHLLALSQGHRPADRSPEDDRAAARVHIGAQFHAGDERRVARTGRSVCCGTRTSNWPSIFIEEFRAAGYLTGDNEPYSGKAPQDYTIDHHAEAIGLPHVGIEIRQDLIDNDEGVEEIAAVMHRIIESMPQRIGVRNSKKTRVADKRALGE